MILPKPGTSTDDPPSLKEIEMTSEPQDTILDREFTAPEWDELTAAAIAHKDRFGIDATKKIIRDEGKVIMLVNFRATRNESARLRMLHRFAANMAAPQGLPPLPRTFTAEQIVAGVRAGVRRLAEYYPDDPEIAEMATQSLEDPDLEPEEAEMFANLANLVFDELTKMKGA